jgi:hypothetical protein
MALYHWNTHHGFVFVESGEFDNYYVRVNGNAVNFGY